MVALAPVGASGWFSLALFLPACKQLLPGRLHVGHGTAEFRCVNGLIYDLVKAYS